MLLYFERERCCAVERINSNDKTLKRFVHGVDLALQVLNLAIRLILCAVATRRTRLGIAMERRGMRVISRLTLREAVRAIHRLLSVRTERNLAAVMTAVTFSIEEFLRGKTTLRVGALG